MSGLFVGKSYRLGGGKVGNISGVELHHVGEVFMRDFQHDGNFFARINAQLGLHVAHGFDNVKNKHRRNFNVLNVEFGYKFFEVFGFRVRRKHD